MRRLEPAGIPIDTPDAMLELLDADRVDPPPGRPWVSTNMVMSLDGAYSRGGTSGALSSTADHELFIAHRSIADAVLVGASTVRAERYSRPSVSPRAAEIRAARGQEPVPRIVITSASLHLPADTPLLDGSPPVPILAHPRTSDPAAAPDGVELLAAGEEGVDFAELLAVLGDRGVRHVACEGGPGVLGQLAAAGLIDEYLLTVSPSLVGGDRVGLLAGATPADADFDLHRVLRQSEHLMLSYRRAGGAG